MGSYSSCVWDPDGDESSSVAYAEYGSTQALGTIGLGSVLSTSAYNPATRTTVGKDGATRKDLERALGIQNSAQSYQNQILQQLNQPLLSRGAASSLRFTNTGTEAKKGFSMVDEFKSYVREYKDWIFTIAIIAVIDHFFLDGALKEKLSAALGKKLDGPSGETK